MDWREARREWDRLAAIDPNFRVQDQELLHARLAHAEGDTATASRLYAKLASGYSTAEIRVRYAHFLYTQKNPKFAEKILKE